MQCIASCALDEGCYLHVISRFTTSSLSILLETVHHRLPGRLDPKKKHTGVGRSDVAVAIIAILWKFHVVFAGW